VFSYKHFYFIFVLLPLQDMWGCSWTSCTSPMWMSKMNLQCTQPQTWSARSCLTPWHRTRWLDFSLSSTSPTSCSSSGNLEVHCVVMAKGQEFVPPKNWLDCRVEELNVMHNEPKLAAEKEALLCDTAWSSPSHYHIILASCLIHSLSTLARIRSKPSLCLLYCIGTAA
jgi:hypothetical protein